ncbi:MAG: Hpt domain-containing protein [Bacteroidales bacterium]
MIDKTTFTAMYENFDKEVVVEIIDIFIKEYPERIAQLEQDIQSGDLESLYKHAHSLKGVIANFYDEEARQLALALETKGKTQDPSGAPELLAQLKTACELLLTELKALRSSYF